MVLGTFAALTLSLFSCKGEKKQEAEQTQTETAAAQTAEPTAPAVAKQFSYTPPVPTNGSLCAVVELGAAGFNSFIIKKDKTAWEPVKADYGVSGVLEGDTSDEEVEKRLKTYIKEIIDQGVPGSKIFFVVSSGAAKEEMIPQIEKLLKKQGYYVNIVTPKQEAEYGFKATVPAEFASKAFFVDMGSGNTKIAYMDQGKTVTQESYGAKYTKKNIDANTAYEDLKQKIAQIPAAQRQYCFLIGGVPYDLAKFTNGGNIDPRYVSLSLKASDYNAFAQSEGEKMQNGINLYDAIMDAAPECEYVVFDTKVNFTIGFLLGLN